MSFSILRSTFLAAARNSPRTSLRPPCIANIRAFGATTCALKATGSLPIFEPTSNPELDTLLATIRNELFVPSHLPSRYKTLMYSKKGHQILAEEPVVVDIGGEEVTLEPKEKLQPMPVKLFTTCLDLMKTPQDLDVLPGLIRGFTQADRRIRERQFEKMARLINMHGRVDLLMQLTLSAGGESGFQFHRALAREFMRGIKMQNSLPRKADSIKGLHYAETLLNALADPPVKRDPNARLKRDPVVVGTVLNMFASTSVRFNDGQDYKGYTNKYTHRLMSSWQFVEWEQNLEAGDLHSVWRAKQAVLDYIPVLEALVTARDILPGLMVMPFLESESAKLNIFLSDCKKFLDEHTRDKKPYGAHSYKEVIERMAREREQAGPEEPVVDMEQATAEE